MEFGNLLKLMEDLIVCSLKLIVLLVGLTNIGPGDSVLVISDCSSPIVAAVSEARTLNQTLMLAPRRIDIRTNRPVLRE